MKRRQKIDRIALKPKSDDDYVGRPNKLHRTMSTSKMAQNSVGLNKLEVAVLKHWNLTKRLQL